MFLVGFVWCLFHFNTKKCALPQQETQPQASSWLWSFRTPGAFRDEPMMTWWLDDRWDANAEIPKTTAPGLLLTAIFLLSGYRFWVKKSIFVECTNLQSVKFHHGFTFSWLDLTHFNWTYYDFVGLSEQFWITMTQGVLLESLLFVSCRKRNEIWEVGSHTWSNQVTCQTIL